MQLSFADFSNINNAINNNNQTKINQAQARLDKTNQVISTVKSVANAAVSIKQTFDKEKAAKEAADAKAKNLAMAGIQAEVDNQSGLIQKSLLTQLESSMSLGSTYFDLNSGEAVIGQDIYDAVESEYSVLLSRDDIPEELKEAIRLDQKIFMDSLPQRIKIAAAESGAVTANAINSEKLTSALQASIESQDFSLVSGLIDNLNLGDKVGTGLKASYYISYQHGLIESQANKIAQTEGIDSAINYINGNSYGQNVSVTLSEQQKSSCIQKISENHTNFESQLATAASNNAVKSRQNGMTYTDIYEASTDKALSEENQQIINDAITDVQVTECVDWWTNRASNINAMSKGELETLLSDLEKNKGLFDVGAEDIYKTYHSTIEERLKNFSDLTAVKSSEFTSLAKNVMTKFNNGQISGTEALTTLRSYLSLTTDDITAYTTIDNYISDIVATKVPQIYKSQVTSFWNSFQKDWLSSIDVKSFNDLTDEQKAKYNQSRMFAEGALADLFMDSANLNATQIETAMEQIKSTFIASYLDEGFSIIEGTNTRKGQQKKLDSASQLQESFNNTMPVYVDNETGKDVWVSEEAHQEFENLSKFYSEEIQDLGFDVTGYHILRNDSDVLPIPVIETKEGSFVVDEENNVINIDNGETVGNLTENLPDSLAKKAADKVKETANKVKKAAEPVIDWASETIKKMKIGKNQILNFLKK